MRRANEKAPSMQAEGFDKVSTKSKGDFKARFTERQRRLAAALSRGRWVSREEVDRIAGASNGPEIVRQLRCRVTGHENLEMRMVDGIDRDGLSIKFGQYRMTIEGIRRALRVGLLGVSDGEWA